MSLLRLIVCLSILSLGLPGKGYSQAPASAPVPGPLGQKKAQEFPAPQPESFTLNIANEGGVDMVVMQDLFKVVERLFAGADLRWDPLGGIMQIGADGKKFQILSRVPAVIIDGQQKRAAHPVKIRQGKVLVPVTTVRILFDALGVNFNYAKEKESEPAAAPPVPSALLAPAPAAPAAPSAPASAAAAPPPAITPLAALQLGQASPASAPPAPADDTAVTTPSAPSAAEAAPPVVLPSYPADAVAPRANTAAAPSGETPLEPPAGLPSKIGLSWGQLADLAHRNPPRRITLICDKAIEAVGQELSRSLQTGSPEEVTLLLAAASSRADETLLSRVQTSRPDLLVDIIVSAQPGLDDGGETFIVWAVHEALWPQDREAGAGADPAQRYRRHQFQSLALGSLLRAELGRQFPDRPVRYELAPSYLLRRVDAPSAEVLIAAEAGEPAQDKEHDRRLAGAIADAIRGYLRGMRQVQF